MSRLLSYLVSMTLSILILAHISDHIRVADMSTALVAATAIGFANTFIRPILTFFTIPFMILTLGLFRLVINGILLYAISYLIDGFAVESIPHAIWISCIISVMSFMLDALIRPR